MEEQIKNIFLKLGADLCGIANIDRFVDAPKGFHPSNIYPDCKSVIVFALSIPRGTALVNPRIIYQHFNHISPVELDRIAYFAAGKIEKNYSNAIAVPLPADGPYDFWDAGNLEGRGVLSMKHAAVYAGIGALGKSTILLNSKYGNMLCIGAVLTNLDLHTDAPAENICIENCRICIDSCPVSAIGEESVNQKLCRNNAYGANDRGFDVVNCNKCRTKMPHVFGKEINL
jgi:epoxyqueuosine reductase